MDLRRKLTLSIVITGIIPAIIISALAIRTTSHMSGDIGKGYRDVAKSLADKIDGNLYERYGDVQSFAANAIVDDKASWYKAGSKSNKIADVCNKYSALYGVYHLSFLVDLEGAVIAVNDLDPQGNPIETDYLYRKSFKNAEWFKETIAERFLKGESVDGTYVQEPHIDEDVKKIYGSDVYTMGFSALVKNAAGKVVGVWRNCANFGLVEEILSDAYMHFRKEKIPTADITLIDSKGRLLVEFDPSATGKLSANHDNSVVLKFNLAENGNEAAKFLIGGSSGFGEFLHTRKNVEQMVGFSSCRGALGFPGLKWGVMVRVPIETALGPAKRQVHEIMWATLVCVLALVAAGWWLSGTIATALQSGINTLSNITGTLGQAAQEISTSSQNVATGASQQAASLEESSASLEEISAMARQTAQNSISGQGLSREAKAAANSGLSRLDEMGGTLASIRSAVKEMELAVQEMQDSSKDVAKIIKTIDEIAFQTNLLALNAAVEAARAGEAGMGFAVVADEVRLLAQRSALAAKETSEKIESSIKRSEAGTQVSEKVADSLTQVESSARNIEETFRGIVEQIASLDGVINEMSSASQEQSMGVGAVNQSVTEMDKVIQTNAASAEENASSAEELSSQVLTLQDVVADLQFLVDGRKVDLEDSEQDFESLDNRRARSSSQTFRVSPMSSRSMRSAKKRTRMLPTTQATESTQIAGVDLIPLPEDRRPDGELAQSFRDF